MQWLPVTTWQYRFQDKETMDALSRGEAVGMFSGRPKGHPTWANKRRWNQEHTR